MIALLVFFVLVTIHLHADNQRVGDAHRPVSVTNDRSAYPKRKTSYSAGTVKGEALDEAKDVVTLRGTLVTPRTPECFPAEPRDLFWQMDQVASGPNGQLQLLNFDEKGDNVVDNAERDAIRGRNTWLLWGGGNETFWNRLQQEGYWLTDFLILMGFAPARKPVSRCGCDQPAGI
jgi:hypothetical protein